MRSVIKKRIKNIYKYSKETMKSEETKPPRIYLSGPITGYDLTERYDTFLAKQLSLEAKGWAVANPLRNGLSPTSNYREHMRRDISMLLECDAVLFMTGFLYSNGCRTEFDVATACGLDVYFEESFNIGSVKKMV